MPAIAQRDGEPGESRVSETNRIDAVAPVSAFAVAPVHFKTRVDNAAPATTTLSYWFLLAFLFLLYANTPFVLPAAEVLRPAKVIAICALLALSGELAFGRRTLQWSWPEGALLTAFVGAAGLSVLGALWPGYAVEALSDLAKMAIVYFFLVNCVSNVAGLRGVMWVMVIGGLFPALGTLKNYLQGNVEEGRAAWVGIFANPNEVAFSLVILLPLIAYLAAPRGWFVRLIFLGISLLFLAAIFVTFSRGGLVGLAAVIGVYAWRSKKAWVRIALVGVVIAGVLLTGKFWSRGEDFTELKGDATFNMRLATSQAGVEMFLDHPLTGVGLNCSVVAWPLYAPKGLHTRGALITHNTFVQVLGETGILGFLPFVLFIGVGIYQSRKLALRPETASLGAAVEGALWGLAACGMSGGYVLTWFPYLLVGLASVARRTQMENASAGVTK